MDAPLILAYMLLGLQLYMMVGFVLNAVSDVWLEWKTGRCRHYGEPLSTIPRIVWADLKRALTWPVNTRIKFFTLTRAHAGKEEG